MYEIWTSSLSKVISIYLCLWLLHLAVSCFPNNIYSSFHWGTVPYVGPSSIMNPSFGNLERRETNTSDMRLGRFMLSPRIWQHIYPIISKRILVSFNKMWLWHCTRTFDKTAFLVHTAIHTIDPARYFPQFENFEGYNSKFAVNLMSRVQWGQDTVN